MTEHEERIDLYPGDLALENVPAVFALTYEPADPSVGDTGGTWAELVSIRIGGLILLRDDVLLMVGAVQLCAKEADVSERLSSDALPGPLRIAAE